MFRRILAPALIALALAGPAAAQQAPSPSHLQAARDVVVLTGVSNSFDGIYTEFDQSIRQVVGTTRPELQKDMTAVLQSLKPEADTRRDQMIARAAEIFAKKMTEADLKEVVSFFRSPVGQRYSALRNDAIDDIFVVLKPWSIETSNYLFDRFSAEMKKRGHQL